MLISAGGLLALGMISLWSALQDAGERELLAAERSTRATAQAMRSAMLDPDLLDALAPHQLYQVEAGALVIPSELRAPSDVDPRHSLSPALRDSLQAAERHQYLGEHAEAEALLRGLSADASVSARIHDHFTLARAWLAHRTGNHALQDPLLDELLETRTETFARDLAGIVLLCSAVRRDLPSWTLQSLWHLDDETLGALLSRIDVEASGALHHAAKALKEQRRALHTAAKNLQAILATDTALAIASDGLILIYHPGEGEAGRGAVLSPTDFLALLTHPPNPWLSTPIESQPIFGPNLDGRATPVLEPLLSLAPIVSELQTGPISLPSLLILLAVSMVLSLFAMLRSMRQESEALRLRAEFLTTVTHELKTPLASIRLLAERLDEGRVQGIEQTRAHYSLLAGEALRLTVLIDNVLDLGRLERGERVYDKRSQDVRNAVREAADLFRPLADRDGLAFDVEITKETCDASIDHAAVMQALVNVLENARKYASSGKRILMTCERSDQELLVRVRDFGPGIDPSERERIFGRFRRGSAQEHGGVPGVGIGLYLARKILVAQGGSLSHEPPESGPGSIFVLTIPLSSMGVTAEVTT